MPVLVGCRVRPRLREAAVSAAPPGRRLRPRRPRLGSRPSPPRAGRSACLPSRSARPRRRGVPLPLAQGLRRACGQVPAWCQPPPRAPLRLAALEGRVGSGRAPPAAPRPAPLLRPAHPTAWRPARPVRHGRGCPARAHACQLSPAAASSARFGGWHERCRVACLVARTGKPGSGHARRGVCSGAAGGAPACGATPSPGFPDAGSRGDLRLKLGDLDARQGQAGDDEERQQLEQQQEVVGQARVTEVERAAPCGSLNACAQLPAGEGTSASAWPFTPRSSRQRARPASACRRPPGPTRQRLRPARKEPAPRCRPA